MIKSSELYRIANSVGVRPQQIEKDYIISWILVGISKNEFLSKTLIFKGGTCLKKIYIDDYRYSEDMDFTINPQTESQISDEELYSAFNNVFVEIKELANIDLSIDESSKDIHESSGSPKFYIDYAGPLGGNGDHVKIDLTRGEKLEYDIVKKSVLNNYSDIEEEVENIEIQCYTLEEVVIEKMTALMGRTVPRDLYDFDYLTNIEGIELQDVYYEFQSKAKHKSQNPLEFVEKVTKKMKKFESTWKVNLSHQMKNLPDFKEVWRDVNKQFRKVEKIK